MIPTPLTVTVTITEQHLANGVRACPAECPFALAISEHDAIGSDPRARIFVGGDGVSLYRGGDLVLTAPNDSRTRRCLERLDSDEDIPVPFTTTLVFSPPAARSGKDRGDDPADHPADDDVMAAPPDSARHPS